MKSYDDIRHYKRMYYLANKDKVIARVKARQEKLKAEHVEAKNADESYEGLSE